MAGRPVIRKILKITFAVIIAANVVMFFHAWRFTHFSEEGSFVRPEEMSASAKIAMLFTGIDNPKSHNDSVPVTSYKTVTLLMPDGRILDAWDIPADEAKGTVILFHGFRGCKASMLPQAAYFRAQGYNTFLMDFTGHGDSKGEYSTLGYHEAEEVEFAYNHVRELNGGKPIILVGSSMGAVAITRAVGVLGLKPDKIILEAPFGNMVQAVTNRCDMAGVPSFPVADMIAFWGSAQQGFWAFDFSPETYARTITVPTLMLYGRHDKKVTLAETQKIYNAIKGEKHLHIFEQAGHCAFIDSCRTEYSAVVDSFLGDTHL